MGEHKFSIKNYLPILAVLSVLVMTVLDVTVMNVALPVLATEFKVSDSATVWIVTSYQLIITCLLLPVSSAGDKFSYKKCFLSGVVIFTLASISCALSNSFESLVVSRATQGIGAALIMGVNIALTRIIYPKEVLGRGLALNAMVIAVSTAAGPTLAGAVLSLASWHWLFLINIPLGIFAFILGKRLLPENPKKTIKEHFDWEAAIENIATFGLIFYSMGSIARKNFSPLTFILLIIGALIGFFYIKREKTKKKPMLPVDLFKIKLFSLCICTSTCSFIAQMISMVSLPFLFLGKYKFSEITTGLLMTPWPLATMIVSPLAARFVEKHNPGLTAASGMGVFTLGLVLLLCTNSTPSPWDIAWRIAVCGIGFGLYQTPNNLVMVLATPMQRTGGAGGMQSTARLMGQTVGATIVTLIFALIPSGNNSVYICLLTSMAFAVIAGIFSLSRVSLINKKERKENSGVEHLS